MHLVILSSTGNRALEIEHWKSSTGNRALENRALKNLGATTGKSRLICVHFRSPYIGEVYQSLVFVEGATETGTLTLLGHKHRRGIVRSDTHDFPEGAGPGCTGLVGQDTGIVETDHVGSCWK
jgi:hypothetical protein